MKRKPSEIAETVLLNVVIFLGSIAVVVMAAAGLSGCASPYKGGKMVEGTDIEVAIKPMQESSISFQFVHYINGFVFYWEMNDAVSVTRKTSSKWSILYGLFEGENAANTDIAVKPEGSVVSSDQAEEKK